MAIDDGGGRAEIPVDKSCVKPPMLHWFSGLSSDLPEPSRKLSSCTRCFGGKDGDLPIMPIQTGTQLPPPGPPKRPLPRRDELPPVGPVEEFCWAPP